MQYHSTREAGALAERLIRGETLLSALIGACKHELLLALCWQAAQSILGLSIPVFVFYFLEWVRDSDEPVATGVGWALAVPSVQGLAAIARHRSTTASHRAGMRARTGIITLTFLSAQQHTRGDGSDGDSQQAVGRFAELIGTGADHVQEFFTIAATLLLLPLEIVGAIAVLWFSVSLASLGALLCVGIVLLAQVRGGRRLETTQIEYDAEVAAFAAELSEACHGVLTIKLSGWTRHFLMCLGESLLNVERLGRTAAQQLAILTPVTNTSVDILSAIIVVLYVLAMDQDLSPSRVASYWIMLSILHARVLELPRAIKHFSVGFSALTRFETALLRENQEHAAHSHRRRNSKESLVGTTKGASLVLNPVVDFSAPNTNHTFVDAVDDRPLLETSRCKPDANNPLSMAVHTIWLRAVYEINQRRQEDTDPTFWSPRCQVAVSVVDGAFGQGDTPILNDINVRIGAGELVCLNGPVGSGKTTLLLGLAGETPCFSGQVEFRRQIDGIVDERRSPPSACAYVPQRPWLQSGTIQENIVFDQPGPLDEERYAAVLQACCLDADIERMAAGDATQVGDGGSNLSGGQRQRVSLARAAYSRAPLVLLDDVFSALDPAVASEVFTRCVIRLMSGRTRVLVTHSEWIAGHADAIFTIDEGAVTSTEVTGFDVTDEEKYDEAHNNTAPADQAVKLTSTDKARGASRGLGRILELLSTSVGGGWFSAGILFMFLAEMIVVQIGVLYLTNFAHLTEEGESPNKGFYIGIYVGSVVFENIAAICRNVIEVEGCYRSHYSLLNSLLDRIFRGDIAYWDRTTSAEVVHYFSRDAGACNSVTVKGTIEEAGYSYGYGIAIVIIACGVVPLFTPVALAVTALHLGLMRVMSAREARKFSANHLPLFSLFNDMLNGLPTIRAATAQLHIYTQFVTSLCDINKFSDATHALETNLFLCTDLLGAVFLGSLLLLIANDRDSIDSGSAAFAILNATFGAGIAHMQVLTKNEIDAVLDARERISDAAAPASASSNEPLDEKGPHPASLYDEQPEVGAAGVQFNQVTLQYDEGPEVITNFSLTIEAGSRVGVLGRTGSGKSTLFRALSGLMRPKYGTILLGGDDVVAMKEDELRAAIAMIPQHPHLFRGTLRYNLDPLGLLDDSALYAALERAQYRDCVTSLDVEIDSCGENLSAGEAQLVCLARAFARGARVILLDEATANLDDTLMERVELALAKCAGQVTVLQIAHQTSAVLPCVQIVVLNAGKIVESGAPSTLLEQGGHFAELWRCDTRRKRSSTTGQDVAQVRISAQAGQNVKPSRQSVESTV